MDWKTILGILGPAILTAAGKGEYAPLLTAGMHITEDVKGPDGETPEQKAARKKQLATEIALAGVNTTNTIAKKTIIEPADMTQAANDTIDLIVDAVNNAHRQVNSVAVVPVK
jgi:hypothetical protein